jgi:hypothetical protein
MEISAKSISASTSVPTDLKIKAGKRTSTMPRVTLNEKRKSRLNTSAHLTEKKEVSPYEREIVMKEGYISYIPLKNGKVFYT